MNDDDVDTNELSGVATTAPCTLFPQSEQQNCLEVYQQPPFANIVNNTNDGGGAGSSLSSQIVVTLLTDAIATIT